MFAQVWEIFAPEKISAICASAVLHKDTVQVERFMISGARVSSSCRVRYAATLR